MEKYKFYLLNKEGDEISNTNQQYYQLYKKLMKDYFDHEAEISELAGITDDILSFDDSKPLFDVKQRMEKDGYSFDCNIDEGTSCYETPSARIECRLISQRNISGACIGNEEIIIILK